MGGFELLEPLGVREHVRETGKQLFSASATNVCICIIIHIYIYSIYVNHIDLYIKC